MDVQTDLLDDDQSPLSDDLAGDDLPLPDGAPAAANGSGAGSLDRRQAAEAYKKVLAGQELTVREQTALKRFEKEKEERLRWQYYASIPQKHWREMSGRQTKVINEQAAALRHPVRRGDDQPAGGRPGAARLPGRQRPQAGPGRRRADAGDRQPGAGALPGRTGGHGPPGPAGAGRAACCRGTRCGRRWAGSPPSSEVPATRCSGSSARPRSRSCCEALDDAEREIERSFTEGGSPWISQRTYRLHPTQTDLRWFLAQARPRRLRTMRQFAEEEIIIPDGPFAGRRFRCVRQPYTGLWFDAVDSGRWIAVRGHRTDAVAARRCPASSSRCSITCSRWARR